MSPSRKGLVVISLGIEHRGILEQIIQRIVGLEIEGIITKIQAEAILKFIDIAVREPDLFGVGNKF